MAITYTRVYPNWLNDEAGGTEADADAFNTIEAGVDAVYKLPNAAGELVYGSAADTLERLAAGTATQLLHGGTTPSWSKVVDGDVDAAAEIVGSKLLPVRVATTVAGLGTAADGALGFLRVGSTPFDFIQLVYDGTYAKWVSSQFCLIQQADGNIQTTQTSYTSLSTGITVPAFLGFKGYYDAGLRPEFRLFARIVNSGANTSSVAVFVEEHNADGTSPGTLYSDVLELTNTGTTTTTKIGAWTTPAGTPTNDHIVCIPRVKVSAGTGTFNRMTLWLRWVSA